MFVLTRTGICFTILHNILTEQFYFASFFTPRRLNDFFTKTKQPERNPNIF